MLIRLEPDGNKTILELLHEKGIDLPADCAGTGRCGKCKVKVVEGEVPVGHNDMRFFSATKYLEGYRIACSAIPVEPIVCEVDDAAAPKVVTEFEDRSETSEQDSEEYTQINTEAEAKGQFYATVDLGTTTLAIKLYDDRGTLVGTGSALNPQRIYGADVISRIQAARSGKADDLRDSVRKKMAENIFDLLQRLKAETESLKLVAVAGNTAMLHILRGFDCEGLAMHPFKPVSLEFEELPAKEIFGDIFPNATVAVFPGISAFVGADIVAGIYGLRLDEAKEPKLLMDIGTNGELVLKTEKGFMCSSSSAGPAFEGGELSCGMAGITGAVESVMIEMEDGEPGVMCRVIGGGAAKGLCGSGALELLSELVKNRLVDEEGTLTEDYFYDGFPIAQKEDGNVLAITQLDIRALQLAKSAVRAASELLLKRAGAKEPDIILAGGMGTFIDPERLKPIGMFPEARSVSFAGNTALLGLKRYIDEVRDGRGMEAKRSLEYISKNCTEIAAAEDPGFQELFLGFMGF